MPFTVGVPRETVPGETRVALTPDVAQRLVRKGAALLVERGAGEAASFLDAEYEAAGCAVVGVFGIGFALTLCHDVYGRNAFGIPGRLAATPAPAMSKAAQEPTTTARRIIRTERTPARSRRRARRCLPRGHR